MKQSISKWNQASCGCFLEWWLHTKFATVSYARPTQPLLFGEFTTCTDVISWIDVKLQVFALQNSARTKKCLVHVITKNRKFKCASIDMTIPAFLLCSSLYNTFPTAMNKQLVCGIVLRIIPSVLILKRILPTSSSLEVIDQVQSNTVTFIATCPSHTWVLSSSQAGVWSQKRSFSRRRHVEKVHYTVYHA